MEFLTDYGLFLAKTLTWVLAIIVIAAALISLRQRRTPSGTMLVKRLNDQYISRTEQLEKAVLTAKQFRQRHKARERARKLEIKQGETPDGQTRPRTFVLHFHGDLRASQVESLREEISAILACARPENDEVLVCLESGGGLVTSYGLAASQLARLRSAGLAVTVSIDKVAASGGYMMAAVAPRIVAAPFAIVGSIGVVAQIPNIHRLLKRHAVDVELLTAGQYKRTITMLGENTEAGREKFQSQLNETHELFKSFLLQYRPTLDLATLATGEYWFGTQALSLGLIDELATSDELIERMCRDQDVFEVQLVRPKPLAKRLSGSVENGVVRILSLLLDQVREKSTNPQERI
jgi:serine protease SohB